MAATTCRPAFSISTSDGIPISSMVKRSASRICAAVRMRTLVGSVLLSESGTGGRDRSTERMAVTVYVNGRITDARDAVVPALDHGFLYGEGVYETIRTY